MSEAISIKKELLLNWLVASESKMTINITTDTQTVSLINATLSHRAKQPGVSVRYYVANSRVFEMTFASTWVARVLFSEVGGQNFEAVVDVMVTGAL